jgi:hypothetical protein
MRVSITSGSRRVTTTSGFFFAIFPFVLPPRATKLSGAPAGTFRRIEPSERFQRLFNQVLTTMDEKSFSPPAPLSHRTS